MSSLEEKQSVQATGVCSEEKEPTRRAHLKQEVPVQLDGQGMPESAALKTSPQMADERLVYQSAVVHCIHTLLQRESQITE